MEEENGEIKIKQSRIKENWNQKLKSSKQMEDNVNAVCLSRESLQYMKNIKL